MFPAPEFPGVTGTCGGNKRAFPSPRLTHIPQIDYSHTGNEIMKQGVSVMKRKFLSPWGVLFFVLLGFSSPSGAWTIASNNVPLDSPVYQWLEKLGGFGLISSDVKGIRPFARAEAARLFIEAEENLAKNPEASGNPLCGKSCPISGMPCNGRRVFIASLRMPLSSIICYCLPHGPVMSILTVCPGAMSGRCTIRVMTVFLV